MGVIVDDDPATQRMVLVHGVVDAYTRKCLPPSGAENRQQFGERSFGRGHDRARNRRVDSFGPRPRIRTQENGQMVGKLRADQTIHVKLWSSSKPQVSCSSAAAMIAGLCLAVFICN